MTPRTLMVAGLIATAIMGSARVAGAVNPLRQGVISSERAVAAGAIDVSETAYLHLVSKRGAVFKVQGYALGTLKLNTVTITVTKISAELGTATLTASSRTGTFSGRAKVKVIAAGPSNYVKGTLEITGGSGSYAGAHGRGLTIAGQYDRQNYHATVRLTGQMHLEVLP